MANLISKQNAFALANIVTAKASEAYRRLNPNSPDIALFDIGFVGLTGLRRRLKTG